MAKRKIAQGSTPSLYQHTLINDGGHVAEQYYTGESFVDSTIDDPTSSVYKPDLSRSVEKVNGVDRELGLTDQELQDLFNRKKQRYDERGPNTWGTGVSGPVDSPRAMERIRDEIARRQYQRDNQDKTKNLEPGDIGEKGSRNRRRRHIMKLAEREGITPEQVVRRRLGNPNSLGYDSDYYEEGPPVPSDHWGFEASDERVTNRYDLRAFQDEEDNYWGSSSIADIREGDRRAREIHDRRNPQKSLFKCLANQQHQINLLGKMLQMVTKMAVDPTAYNNALNEAQIFRSEHPVGMGVEQVVDNGINFANSEDEEEYEISDDDFYDTRYAVYDQLNKDHEGEE